MIRHTLTLVAALLVALPAAAQQRDSSSTGRPPVDTAAARRAAERQFGRSMSQAEVLSELRASGMSRAQVRARLQQAGYDPRLADYYFDMIERGESGTGTASNDFVEALSTIGVTARARLADTRLFDDTLAVERDTLPPGLRVFGRSLFAGARGGAFEQATTGPVDRGYRLGPGDQILLVITGDVEVAHNLDVSREGVIFIPDVGQVVVNGLTIAGLEDVLYQRLQRVYSGVSRSADATTRFHVTLGQLRTNQVFVIGEVERPGGFELSSVSRVLNALFLAGGPAENGSFRRIEVRRGGVVAGTFDLYRYLLDGDSRGDIRLEHNDNVFVPIAGAHVTVEGAVRRPAIFELLPGEGLVEVIDFAGGFRADAIVRRILVDRILPPEQRRPGINRVQLDVDPGALRTGQDFELRDGDVVTVLSIDERRRNVVWIDGGVRVPGSYQWAQGMTLLGLIDRAEGLEEQAYTPRVLIYRLDPADNTRRLIRSSLTGPAARDVQLEDRDSVVVLDREVLHVADSVTISGFVKMPASYSLPGGMTLQDLVLVAGGFTEGAWPLEAELTRLPDPAVRGDTAARVFRVTLGSDTSSIPVWDPVAGETVLQRGDRIFIRRAPGYTAPREVVITGEVRVPGRYVLGSRNDRVADLVGRAGGITAEAFVPGMHVIRGGDTLAADIGQALRDRNSRANVLLEAGDSVHIPGYDPTVLVMGAVVFETRTLYIPGADVEEYLRQAGGTTDMADTDRITVVYPNGQRAAVERFLLWSREPEVLPGSVIHVAEKSPGSGRDWEQTLTRALTLVSTLVTLLVAANQVK